MDKETEGETKAESGGLLDFLPFVGGEPKKVEPEKLTPSPLPKESKPVLSARKMQELQEVADKWLTTSEYTEPMLRRNGNREYYRDYIVFATEYKAEVLRGDKDERPFVGNIYVKGDYFFTKAHPSAADAESDFSFDYQPREFRVVFERLERWDYSDKLDEKPFVFTERWEFRKLQTKSVVGLPESAPASTSGTSEKKTDSPKPSNE
ncbi:hypothetical protein HZA56_09685 [Candidatus Poribacteria bacterium]|nr:hypothetical protein [Candidatus Poribacteria bacterium]